ncbi:hypothetical protein BGZ76_010313 [Entomortierella beljakovae]|nr:hypothetical protein BGZ76_010313 [Entomortierella beljakovae]
MPNQQQDMDRDQSSSSHYKKDVAKLYPITAQGEIGDSDGIKPIPTPLTIDYLYYYTCHSQIPRAFRAFELLDPMIQKYQVGPRKTQAIDQSSTNLALALSGHFPSRIQVLSMTPAQIRDIWQSGVQNSNGTGLESENSAVKSLKMLRRLELDLRQTGSSLANLGFPGADKIDLLQYPLLFIQEHQRIYDSCPEDLPKDPPGLYGWSSEHLDSDSRSSLWRRRETKEINGPLLQELVIRGHHINWRPVDLLSQIAPLKVVDLSAWNADVPGVERIPTSRLRSLKINIERRLDFVKVPIEFLKCNCKHLQEIWMPAQSEYTFRWAIDPERPIGQFVSQGRLRRRLETHASAEMTGAVNEITNSMASASVDQQQSSQVSEPGIDSKQIPLLQVIKLYGTPRDLVVSLEDAADAFRDTLVELSGYEDGYSGRHEYPHISFSWSLPHLTRLDLRGRFVFFLDLGSLRFAPNLRVVKLAIESNMLEGAERRERENGYPDFSAFADLRLDELQLRGSSWGIDNSTLETLIGRQPQHDNDGPEPSNKLTESLICFGINEAHRIGRRGLIPFVKAMKRLQVLQLGTAYKYALDSVREAAGPRLYIDIDSREI